VMATVGPAALLVTATAGWLLAKAALEPVEDMRREAAAISASEPARRLPVPVTGDELARLASTLNAMLDRLQEALERERRFVDDASHELRTPLATLRGEIELALARSRTAPELEASMRSIKEDVDRLGRLAEDLLVLARARGGRIPLRRVPTSLNELVTRSIRSVAGRARDRAIEVSSDATSERVNVDPERVEQALRNLLENAVRHTPAGGTVHVAASSSDGEAQFLVEDSGSGFPPELIGTAFDAFARGIGEGDGDGGAGLGLTIVRAVAEAHGGSATAENTPTGARVTLTLRT
jgi:two-component system, OmpR family, sensor kinase